MNRKLTAVFVAVCCLAVAITMVAQGGGDTSATIEKLVREMRDAQKNGDVTWFQQHYADGYVEGHSWGDWATKAEAIKQLQDKSTKFTKSEISDVQVETFGPNTAIARHKFTYDATFQGTHRARTVICTDVFVNQSGAWKLAANHCSHVEGT